MVESQDAELLTVVGDDGEAIGVLTLAHVAELLT